jgi:hypothetical protein
MEKMKIYFEKLNFFIDDNRESLPAVAAVLTFLYEFRYLRKTKQTMNRTNWFMCFAAAGLSYGFTALCLVNFEDLVPPTDEAYIDDLEIMKKKPMKFL